MKNKMIAMFLFTTMFTPFPTMAQTPFARPETKLAAKAAQPKTIVFDMIVSGGAANCLPKATAIVTVHTAGEVEHMHVVVKGLPKKTDFDLFNIQVPKAPFGLSWYLGDIETDSRGVGVGNFVGRFNVETFILSPGALPSAQVFPSPPAVLPQSTTGVLVNPVQIYHLGLWFNSPDDAQKNGCPATATPFNGEHNAGIQVLNTANFPDAQGPLFDLK